jgi:hypothetical protein
MVESRILVGDCASVSLNVREIDSKIRVGNGRLAVRSFGEGFCISRAVLGPSTRYHGKLECSDHCNVDAKSEYRVIRERRKGTPPLYSHCFTS